MIRGAECVARNRAQVAQWDDHEEVVETAKPFCVERAGIMKELLQRSDPARISAAKAIADGKQAEVAKLSQASSATATTSTERDAFQSAVFQRDNAFRDLWQPSADALAAIDQLFAEKAAIDKFAELHSTRFKGRSPVQALQTGGPLPKPAEFAELISRYHDARAQLQRELLPVMHRTDVAVRAVLAAIDEENVAFEKNEGALKDERGIFNALLSFGMSPSGAHRAICAPSGSRR